MKLFFKWLGIVGGILAAIVGLLFWIAELEARRIESAVIRG